MKKGVALIKSEFLVVKESKSESECSAKPVEVTEKRTNEVLATDQPSDGNPKKRKRRGQNKQRQKFSDQRAAPEHRLCKAIICGTTCSYGDTCKFSHDVADFISKKPADLPEECYNFVQHGRCPYGFACRFAKSHVKQIDGKFVNVVDKEKISDSRSINSLNKDNFMLLRKHKYDFSQSSQATAEALNFVDKIVKLNVELNCTKKSKSGNAASEYSANALESPTEESSTENSAKQESPALGKSVTATPGTAIGTVDTLKNEPSHATGFVEIAKNEPLSATEAVETVKNEPSSATEAVGTVKDKSCSATEAVETVRNESLLPTGIAEIGPLSATGTGEAVKNEALSATETAEPIKKEPLSATEHIKPTIAEGKTVLNKQPTGPIINEEFTIKPGEKKTIDFRNKLYLAPLTTVGNLPFRRVCKSYGADITCGEMALATKILQGVNSEWALIKRHSSEDLFGVQLCGAFADTMTKCTQLITETCDVDFIDINVGCPIDLIFDQGAGSALMRRANRFHEMVRSMVQVSNVPITVKIRTGIAENKSTAHTLIPKLRDWGVALTTLHGRSREQRYTKAADWSYIDECAILAAPMPFFGGGDILSFEDYNRAMTTNVSGTMIARGALIKPWLFTEIKEQRHWDISSSERLDILRDFSNYGLEHWGSDQQGVETTRKFMLEWLSFLHRYIPVGLLERLPQKINERPSPYFGRDDLETLMASPNSADWVKISEMLLGPVPSGFFFIPKHRANSYD